MRLLLIGDIVGKPGRKMVEQSIKKIRESESIDFVVANAENSAAGSGLMPDHYHALTESGVDCVTLGDHCYRRREIIPILSSAKRIIRPGNYPNESPGRGWTVLPVRGQSQVAVIVLLGRVFMSPVDCPFHAADRILDSIGSDVKTILVDFHAEATSDMQLMGRYLDGRVSAVLGTHTHVATADEQIFPGGTAFQADVGMTGPHESILGRRIDRVSETVRTYRPNYYEVATGDVRICGTLVDVDPETGHATAIRRLMVTEEDLEK
jgi:2',3'-cyclic-nucleotide 2'-phosphodiesterase